MAIATCTDLEHQSTVFFSQFLTGFNDDSFPSNVKNNVAGQILKYHQNLSDRYSERSMQLRTVATKLLNGHAPVVALIQAYDALSYTCRP